MGILRTDKVSGLETPTAVTGSVVFDGTGDYLAVTPINNSFVNWWQSDFTIEAWIYADSYADWWFNDAGAGSDIPVMVGHFEHDGAVNYWSFGPVSDNTVKFYYWKGSQNHTFVTSDKVIVGEWSHIAMTYSIANGAKLFINGRGTDYISLSGTPQADISAAEFNVGQYNSESITGYVSNLRILNGTALYTSDFTVPAHALEVIGDTGLLCCNNSDSAGADGTGKTITVNGDAAASTVSPGLTRDFTYGTEFNGVTTFDTQGYFVPPSGTTTERYVNVATQASSSARGVFMGGLSSAPSGSVQDVMDYVTVTSTGNAADFGNLTAATRISSSCSSTTRGVRMGGFSDPATVDVIDYITIASTGNAQDFGNLSSAKHSIGGSANSTRGLSFGSSGLTNAIQFITISTTGDAQDFGDMVDGLGQVTGTASPTRCVMAGGEAPTRINTMQYVTIMSMGNAFDFGDLTIARSGVVSLSSATRGLYLGGELPASPSFTNTVDFVQIATTGNAINFGDLDNSNGMRLGATAASPTRGLYAGGGNDQPVSNTAFTKIHLFTIASTGNATDFGDITVARFQMNNGTVSSGHGGLG